MQISRLGGLFNQNQNSFGLNNVQQTNSAPKTRFQARIVPSAAIQDTFVVVGEKIAFDPAKENKSSRENTIKLRDKEKEGYRDIIS